jgi:translocon-associated protein subunit beta
MRTTKLFWALAALLLISSAMHVRAEGVEDGEEEDEYEDVARAHLIVRKSVGDDLVVQGRNVTVTISIFNAGAA